MNMYFTPVLWRYLSYSKEEDLHDKPNLRHVKRLYLGFDTTMRHTAALIQRILSFVKLLPTLEYGHVSLNLTDAPEGRSMDSDRRRQIDAKDQKMIRSLVSQLDTAFTNNGACATWSASCAEWHWQDVISGSSSIAMPALVQRHRPTLTINAANVGGDWDDHGIVLLGNESIAVLTESSESDMEDEVPKDPTEWLKIDTVMQGFCAPTWEYLESVSKRISHLRIGGAGGMWSKKRGRIYYETEPWPIIVRGNRHNLDKFNLHTLSLHVTTSAELNDVRKMILLSHNTLQYLDILLNTHFLESLLRLVDYVKSFHDDNLSHSSLKEVHVHWAGPNWAQDDLAEEESLLAQPRTTWNVYGVREGNRHTLARWSKILQLGNNGQALRPLKEDLRAVLAGYWKQKGVIFKMTGVGRELDFMYEWPVCASQQSGRNVIDRLHSGLRRAYFVSRSSA